MQERKGQYLGNLFEDSFQIRGETQTAAQTFFFKVAHPPSMGAVSAQQEHRTFHSETVLSESAAGINLEFSTPGTEPVYLSRKREALSCSESFIPSQTSTAGVNPASRREVEISSNLLERNF